MNKLISLLSIVGLVLLAILFTSGLLAEELHGSGFNDASITNGNWQNEPAYQPTINRGRLAKRFQRLDSDHNGVLTENEVSRPRSFQRMDQNGDGVVTPREFRIFQRNRRNSAINQVSSVTTRSNSPRYRSGINADHYAPSSYEVAGEDYPLNMPNQAPRNRLTSAESGTWHSSSYTLDDTGSNGGNRIRRFQQLDKDGNGNLSPNELGRPRLFQRMDQNGDGIITLQEFRAFYRSRRQIAAPDSANTGASMPLYNRSAPNNPENDSSAVSPNVEQGDRASDDEEIIDQPNIDQPRNRENASKRFQRLDRDNNGSLSQEEIGRSRLFRRMDSNADGKVTFTEFIEFRKQRRIERQDSAKSKAALTPSASPQNTNSEQITTGSPTVNQSLNIPYNEIPGVDPNLLSLDIYAPKDDQRQHPVMVMIHGGSLKGGDKANLNVGPNKAQFFVSIGYVFVSINYRLSPAVKHPTHVQDVATAISWIHSNINQYGGDTDNIYLMGHSVGAYLAALVTTDEKYLAANSMKLSNIKGVILLDGAGYNLTKTIDELDKGSELRSAYESAFGINQIDLQTASPITHISPRKNIPPFLIFYRISSRTGKILVSDELTESLEKANIPVKAVSVSEKNHEQMNNDVGKPGDILTTNILEFIKPFSTTKAAPIATPLTSSADNAITKKGLSLPLPFVESANGLAHLKFTKDYLAGNHDNNGNYMGGTETNAIVAHNGQLYAAISYWNWNKQSKENPGPQILVKRAYNTSWEVDTSIGNDYQRIASLRSITFTTDGTGKKLEPPVSVLLAGTKWLRDNKTAVMFTKSNSTGTWKRIVVPTNEPRTRNREVRVFYDHIDHTTGIHYVFAGINNTLYRGVYDPQIPEQIRWEPDPEMRWSAGRVLAAADANGIMHVTANINPNVRGEGGLFKRIDGPSPHWELVYEWKWSHPNPQHPAPKYGMRGLTAIRAQDGHELLLGAREHPGIIERIDPKLNYAVYPELDVRDLVRQYLMNSREYQGVTLIAYNDMIPIVNPENGTQAHLIGLWINPDSPDSRIRMNSWYLIRWADGNYSLNQIIDPNNSNPPSGLRGARTICKSPFPQDRDKIYYFGGFDAAKGPHLNTAWIYKAELPLSAKVTN